jgi:hypothetical protein
VSTVVVRTVYDATPQDVWRELAVIEHHVQWMSDAVKIEFTSDQRRGVGTSFRCTTKVGPFVTDDLMTVTRWDEGSAMGVDHRGLIRGSGSFTIQAEGAGASLTWREQLTFPWWALGSLGARVAAPVLATMWKKNLRAFGELLSHTH